MSAKKLCVLFLLSRQLNSQSWLFTSIRVWKKNCIKHWRFYSKINQAFSWHESPSSDPPYVVNDKAGAISLSCYSFEKKFWTLCNKVLAPMFWRCNPTRLAICQTWVIFFFFLIELMFLVCFAGWKWEVKWWWKGVVPYSCNCTVFMKPSKTRMYRAVFSTTIKKLLVNGQQLPHRPAD